MSRQSWQLNCVNGVWTGTVGVCNEIDEMVTEQVMSLQAETVDMTISLANKSFYFPKTAIV
jgi:hypothetical protein